jgi:hypothetical protein
MSVYITAMVQIRLQYSAANHPDPRELPTLTFGNSPEIRADNVQ